MNTKFETVKDAYKRYDKLCDDCLREYMRSGNSARHKKLVAEMTKAFVAYSILLEIEEILS